jgi:hypothetical protein
MTNLMNLIFYQKRAIQVCYDQHAAPLPHGHTIRNYNTRLLVGRLGIRPAQNKKFFFSRTAIICRGYGDYFTNEILKNRDSQCSTHIFSPSPPKLQQHILK